MIQKMIQQMTESGEYPKKKLDEALTKYEGIQLEYRVSLVYAEWAMTRRLPAERFNYGQEYNGLWQGWAE